MPALSAGFYIFWNEYGDPLAREPELKPHYKSGPE